MELGSVLGHTHHRCVHLQPPTASISWCALKAGVEVGSCALLLKAGMVLMWEIVWYWNSLGALCVLGSMGVVMLDVGGPLWRCKVLQLNSGLVLYAKDGKRQCICMYGGEGRSLPLSTASGGLSPSSLLKQCDSYNAYLYINTISAKQLKSAPTEKIGTTLISRNSRFCPLWYHHLFYCYILLHSFKRWSPVST